MRIVLKLALLSATALLLLTGSKIAYLGRSSSKLESGEWTQADAEAIGRRLERHRQPSGPRDTTVNRRMTRRATTTWRKSDRAPMRAKAK
jgi:hypothetical protein